MAKSLKSGTYLYVALIVILSYFSIFKDYQEPTALFWDENYHIAAAQKYLNGVFFMEPHPPLGKLLIAAGEFLFASNDANNQFISTDHAPTTPPDFSFVGYRFFPVLLAAFCPLLLFFIVRCFSTDWLAVFAAFLFATDNALIVHLRGAMLEGVQLFFILAFLLSLALLVKCLYESARISTRKLSLFSILLGSTLAAVLTTKLNGIILLIPLLPVTVLLLYRKLAFVYLVNFTISFFGIFLLVWAIHISSANRIEPKLPDNGFYQASVPYRLNLRGETEVSPSFFAKLYDHFAFLPHYTKGVPELNYCKKDENGSPWYWWLVGGKTISYRWDKEDNLTRYLYLVSNPVGWGLSLAGVILAVIFAGGGLLFSVPAEKRELSILSFLLLSWIAYIGIFGSMGRVMYLYHYFIPLVLGWMMLAFVCSRISCIASFRLSAVPRLSILGIVCLLQTSAYFFFAPLSYGKGLSDAEFKSRSWLAVWDLRCAGCNSLNPLARPLGDPKRSFTPEVVISGLRAIETYQEWGEPVINRSVTKEAILVNGKKYSSAVGVHAGSRVVFDTNKKFFKFSSSVALPDYIKLKSGGSVIFSVVADGRKIWESNKISAGMEPEKVNLIISEVDRLSLEVSDAGDGNTDDHAVWIEPRLE